MTSLERTFEVIVVPRASKTEIVPYPGTALKIKLKAPPVDDAANEELVRFLAKHFDLARSRIQIIRGQRSRRKTIKIS